MDRNGSGFVESFLFRFSAAPLFLCCCCCCCCCCVAAQKLGPTTDKLAALIMYRREVLAVRRATGRNPPCSASSFFTDTHHLTLVATRSKQHSNGHVLRSSRMPPSRAEHVNLNNSCFFIHLIRIDSSRWEMAQIHQQMPMASASFGWLAMLVVFERSSVIVRSA